MARLELVTAPASVAFAGFEEKLPRFKLVAGVRLLFLLGVLVVSLLLQNFQPQFVNTDSIVPVYTVLSLAFLLNAIAIFGQDWMVRHWHLNWVLFVFETLTITALMYFTGFNYSLFLFLYLVNIILCGLVFDKNGAFILALVTAIFFNGLMILNADLEGQSLFFASSLNNLAFFAVAGLSGYLSEQVGLLGQEVRARRRDVEALKELNSMIVDNIATGLVAVDLGGRIHHVNRASLKILEDANLLDRHIAQVLPALGPHLHFHDVHNSKRVERLEVQKANHRGETTIIEVLFSPLFNADGDFRGYVLLLQDLTEVKRLEFAMRQKEKLAAVGQLAAGIAHEIRNPLASISGSIQLLGGSKQMEAPEDQKLMKIVVKEIDRLNDLINEFLDFVRPDAQIENPIVINNLLSEIVEMAKVNTHLPRNVETKTFLNAHKMILGDANKLKQALLNIVINAYQAMEHANPAFLTIETHDKEKSVVVTIRDTGPGIEEQNLKRIFEPFHTTKANGTGLGLAITHKILENHQARIFVESEIGKGTLFILEFPAVFDTDADEISKLRLVAN